jgi:hypothetical protein
VSLAGSSAKQGPEATVKNRSVDKSDVLAPPEDLSGTITRVSPSNKELTLICSNGVPYDFLVTKKTNIEMADHGIPRNRLSADLEKAATIHFVPTTHGNVAESIQIRAC